MRVSCAQQQGKVGVCPWWGERRAGGSTAPLRVLSTDQGCMQGQRGGAAGPPGHGNLGARPRPELATVTAPSQGAGLDSGGKKVGEEEKSQAGHLRAHGGLVTPFSG